MTDWTTQYKAKVERARVATGESVNELAVRFECSPSLIRKGSRVLEAKLDDFLARVSPVGAKANGNGASAPAVTEAEDLEAVERGLEADAVEAEEAAAEAAAVEEGARVLAAAFADAEPNGAVSELQAVADLRNGPVVRMSRLEALQLAAQSFAAAGEAPKDAVGPETRVTAPLAEAGIVGKRRLGWVDALAKVVANGMNVTPDFPGGGSSVVFVGPQLRAEAAAALLVFIATFAETQSLKDRGAYWAAEFKKNGHRRGLGGYRKEWLEEFTSTLGGLRIAVQAGDAAMVEQVVRSER